MKEFKQHKLRFNPFLENLYQSDKPLIIYKVEGGYDLFTDFSQKIIINNKNVEKFLNSFKKKKYKRETDIFIGFFGYEILDVGTFIPFPSFLKKVNSPQSFSTSVR